MHKKSQILFITTSSLATNPRLVKEFETLKEEFDCHVICFKHQDWSLPLSEEIKLRNREVNFIEIDRNKAFLETIISKVLHKSAIALNKLFSSNFHVCAFASNDKTPQLWLKTRRFLRNHNLSRVVAHNLGAFFPARKLAFRPDIKLQLDIEDYHPGEELYFNKSYELQNRLVIMQSTFNHADVITYASEGIKLKCNEVFKLKPQTKSAVLINAFKSDDFPRPNMSNGGINFVWFSQNISPKRGLEQLFDAAREFSEITFHVVGKPNQNFIDSMEPSKNVIIRPAMQQDELHHFLSTMDVGLALEDKKGDVNKDICLSNKIVAYAQAGLYILATNTFGQAHFLEQLGKQSGKIIKSSLREEIGQLDQIIFETQNKVKRWNRAKVFSWEKQSLLLQDIIK